MFLRQWLYFGHTSEIPAAGDYLVQEILGESVIVVRDARDAVHGFSTSAATAAISSASGRTAT